MKNWRLWFIAGKETVVEEKHGLNDYFKASKGKMLIVVWKENTLKVAEAKKKDKNKLLENCPNNLRRKLEN